MASARISFEIDGVTHSLYFGMVSVQIFQEKGLAESIRLQQSGIETPTQKDFDPYLLFSFVVHSGLCNMADINGEQRPLFVDSYSLSEIISKDEPLWNNINKVWEESQPVKDMLDRLKISAGNTEKKKESQSWDEIEAFAFGQLGLKPIEFYSLTYRQYVNLCVGHKDKELKTERVDRMLIYNVIKGWADPKKFTISMQRFWPIEGDREADINMPTKEELMEYDRRFRELAGRRKWLE